MKIKYALVLITVLTIGNSYSVYAEDNFITNFQKYWNYRYILLGDRIDPSYEQCETGMLRVGDCVSCSQPATSANPLAPDWRHDYYSDGGCLNQEVHPILHNWLSHLVS